MLAVIIRAPGEVSVEECPEPQLVEPTDAIIRLSLSCVCGSDLWDYRGLNGPSDAKHMGHEYVGVVQDVGAQVATLTPGDHVVGSFFASDNQCEICRSGFQSACVNNEFVGGAQAQFLRVPLADGTLVKIPSGLGQHELEGVLACSDVLGTGWFAAVAAGVGPGDTAAVVGDGAVGLCGILAARELGAERIIAMSGHPARQEVARRFGATDIVSERAEGAVARVRELTGGFGAHATLECVGTPEAMTQALGCTRPGGGLGFVGVPHGVVIDGESLFYSRVRALGGPAPVRRFLPDLVSRVLAGSLDPTPIFDLTVPLTDAGEAYEAMDQRRAIKALLTV